MIKIAAQNIEAFMSEGDCTALMVDIGTLGIDLVNELRQVHAQEVAQKIKVEHSVAKQHLTIQELGHWKMRERVWSARQLINDLLLGTAMSREHWRDLDHVRTSLKEILQMAPDGSIWHF